MVIIREKVVNKANNYEIRINPSLWRDIKGMVGLWRSRNGRVRPWWIGPSDETKTFQELVAWAVKVQCKERFGKEEVAVAINLINQGVDVDALKAAIDGIQDSGVIENDRQIKNLSVVSVKRDGHGPSLEIAITRLV